MGLDIDYGYSLEDYALGRAHADEMRRMRQEIARYESREHDFVKEIARLEAQVKAQRETIEQAMDAFRQGVRAALT